MKVISFSQPAIHTHHTKQKVDTVSNIKTIQYANDKKSIDAVRTVLAEVVGSTYNVDQGVAYHTDPPNKISLPEGMTPGKGAKVLADLEKAGQQMETYNHRFMFRPWDGAYAVTQVMRKYFGTQGRGRAQVSFFGSTPPQKINVQISPTEQVSVPWGQIEFAPLEGYIELGSMRDPEFGSLFVISITCPNKFLDMARGFCMLVEAELKENSIYKGKAISGTQGEPKFIDVKPNETIVYNEDVELALYTSIWGVIEWRELMKADGRKVNKRVLLHGPYGTGKSEAGMRTADVAVRNGTTFIQFRSGKDNLDELEACIATARLYSPSVVFVEDVDVYASNADEAFQTRLSNLFDGIGSKGDEVMIVMTSNKAASFSKGMLRAGRIDSLIEVGPLNKEATQELIRRVIGSHRLAEDLDYDRIWEAMDGFAPAFVRQTFDKAAEAALLRTGSRDYVLSTEDFVAAAKILRPQWELHNSRVENKEVTFDSVMRQTIREEVYAAVNGAELDEGDNTLTLPVPPARRSASVDA